MNSRESDVAAAPAPAALPTPDFARFPRDAELGATLRAYAAARPDICELRSIGRSHEGRDIWLVVLTRRSTGADLDKPAFWIDANIHAAELTACTAALYYLHQLCSGDGVDARITHLLDTRAVYICPRLNPDGAELALADVPRFIRSSTRAYPFDEEHVDGMTMEDVDGDGRVLYMRLPDAHGTWKRHPQEPRLMVAREPGEFGGEYFRVIPEGTLAHWDGVRMHVNRDREGLDLNRNFPSLWRQEFEQAGAGPYPTSEPEVRAMVDFCVAHPNIGAGISFHTHSGVILRPMGAAPDDDMIPEDLWMLSRLSDIGAKLTGYPAVSSFHGFKYHPKEIITGTQDWLYEHLGAMCWTVEIWAPNREAGIEHYDLVHWYRDHPPEDDLKLLKWSDEQCGGLAHVDWKPFQHPQLGAVEIGGWDRMNFWRNPPPHLREREAARFPAWLTQLALALPKLELLQATCEPLGHDGSGDTWRVRLAVGNAGYLPAYGTRRAKERQVVRGTVFEIALPGGATLLAGKPREIGPHLEGHAPGSSLQAFLPDRALTADRALQEWIVRGAAGATITLSARADRAGAVKTQIVLGSPARA